MHSIICFYFELATVFGTKPATLQKLNAKLMLTQTVSQRCRRFLVCIDANINIELPRFPRITKRGSNHDCFAADALH